MISPPPPAEAEIQSAAVRPTSAAKAKSKAPAKQSAVKAGPKRTQLPPLTERVRSPEEYARAHGYTDDEDESPGAERRAAAGPRFPIAEEALPPAVAGYRRGGDGLTEYVDSADAGPELPDPRPYQRKVERPMVLPGGVVKKEIAYEWDLRGLRRWLIACPKLTISIPLGPNDPQPPAQSWHHVWYDGYLYPIEKGQTLRVPAPIALIVKQMQQPVRTAQATGQSMFEINPMNPRGAYIDYEGTGKVYPTGMLTGQQPAYEE